MTEHLLTCVLCGRRGVTGFVMTAADPDDLAGGDRARCANQAACQRRRDDAAEQATTGHQPGTGQQSAGPLSGEQSGPVHEECAPVGSVAGLASEVEQLRRDILALRGVAGQVEDLARVMGELAERVATLAARPTPGSAVSWLDLPAGSAVAVEVLQQLVTWLGEVLLRYADARAVLPDCWMWHPDVVEELLWLMAVWQTAYRTDEATAAQAGDWHDRYRPGVVRRIKAAVGTCSLDNHLPRGNRGSDPTGEGRPVVPLADALDSIATWWGSRRHQPAPEPTAQQLAAQGADRSHRPHRTTGRP